MRRWAALIAIAGLALLVVADTAPRTASEEHIVVIGHAAVGELTVTYQTFADADAEETARELSTTDRRTPSTTAEVPRGHLLTGAPQAVVQTRPNARPLRPGTVVPALALFGVTLVLVRFVERRRA